MSISPDIIYFIMGSNSVYIRSTYQLDSNTLLVDLTVPTGELDFNSSADFIGACNKYFWNYQEETYICFIEWKHRNSMKKLLNSMNENKKLNY